MKVLCKTGYLYRFKVTPHKVILITKEKETTMKKPGSHSLQWSTWTSITEPFEIMHFLIEYNEENITFTSVIFLAKL